MNFHFCLLSVLALRLDPDAMRTSPSLINAICHIITAATSHFGPSRAPNHSGAPQPGRRAGQGATRLCAASPWLARHSCLWEPSYLHRMDEQDGDGQLVGTPNVVQRLPVDVEAEV